MEEANFFLSKQTAKKKLKPHHGRSRNKKNETNSNKT